MLLFPVHLSGAATFGQGLQAKLSLRNTSKSSHPISVVTLIQNKETNKQFRLYGFTAAATSLSYILERASPGSRHG
jgi:hypothetical protein